MKEASPAAAVVGPPEFSEHERYLFDLHGVMQVEDALTAEQCDRLNAALDAEIAARQEAGLAFQNSPEWFGDEEKPAQTLRLGDMADPALGMDKEFLKLVDNPRVSCYLDAMYTSPHFAEGSSKAAAFRIDHICKCQRSLCLLSEAQMSTIRRRHHQSARLARRAGGQDDRRPDRHGPAQDRAARCLLPDGEWQDVQRPAHRGLPASGRRPGAGRLVSAAAPFASSFEPQKTRLHSACILGSHKSGMDDYFQSADWRVLKEDKETGVVVPDYVTRLGGKKGSAIICAPLAPSPFRSLPGAHGSPGGRGSHGSPRPRHFALARGFPASHGILQVQPGESRIVCRRRLTTRSG